MSLSQNPPPLNSPVDVNGKKIEWAWLQWFQVLYNNIKAIMGSLGGQYINSPYGTFYSTSNQTLSLADTPTRVAMDTQGIVNGTYRVIGDGVHVQQSGVYQYEYALQIANTDASIFEAVVWLKKNGTDIPNSAYKFSVPGKHAGIDGYYLASAPFMMSLNANDYIELWWASNSTTVYMEAYTAQTVPYVRPAIPSVIVTINHVSS